ncbi:hypothetical protein DYB25_000752 [Aphanomyces astaci]|uniref:Tyrosine--tRNA ligase n=1 Tax=Aphanomyces astaci TaxID=112090 RepID=A0A397C748_APHAT|nr:hypothetical protein DYB25_000752 [Aphanomyces astaci]RHY41618.1 hypothetical protein DYB38_000792 [Aphanomyces astaci]
MSRALAALRSRGLLAGLTHEHATSVLDAAVAKHQANPSSVKAVGVYCGFDPTASSLHVGNLVTVMALRHFQLAGVGGATGMIGDPSMRSDERVMLTADAVATNARHLVDSLKNVLDFDCPNVGAEVANNMTWHGHMSVIDWMRECGAFARVNAMLARDSVKRRLDAESGLSFLEFSYQLFQAFDFVYLRRHHNVLVQVGGSDQWGNIVSGCDLVRKTDGHEVYGVTVPLLTTANGDKFGKSAGNAVWLDAAKTSVNINTAISVTLFVVAEGRRLIKAGGVYINNVRVDSDAAVIEASQVIEGRAVLVRVGKRNYHVLHISDSV